MTVLAVVVLSVVAVVVGFATRVLRRDLRASRVALDALGELGLANRALADQVTRQRDLTARIGDTVTPRDRS